MPAIDKSLGFSDTARDPVGIAEAVTPSDSEDLTYVSRALWVGTEGNLSVITAGGQTVALANVNVGWHPIRVSRIRSTGTTATDIVAWS